MCTKLINLHRVDEVINGDNIEELLGVDSGGGIVTEVTVSQMKKSTNCLLPLCLCQFMSFFLGEEPIYDSPTFVRQLVCLSMAYMIKESHTSGCTVK